MRDDARLARIRDQLAAIAPGRWTQVHDGDGCCFLEARTRTGDTLPIVRFDPAASQDEITFVADAPETVRFLLGLVDRAITAVRGREPHHQPARGLPATARKNYAAEAAMLCSEPAFMAFLHERHGLEKPLTEEKVAQRLRGLLGVTSRRDLNDNDDAAERWRVIRGDFDTWKRTGR
ncbi:hypothetical protein EET67_09810 [Pseudaminobacter arsenicus]|uniref:Uncharacterized protein n=1 Tax=Borborobacter arsenicus TaxID=1851146 RepID=A0A432V744_9HYPH|nr:hypothetical protein [Pseudaminobacter arsenicus]RUM97903.1 hypothetical protein EET67_09810 [Pseudaminobacter arsenicus]